jgi:PKD repeat protein
VYNGANHPPAAGISVDQTSGAAPLTVASDGTGANDLDAGDVLGYAWDLGGDGQVDDSTARRPTHTYAVPGTVTARLRVADPVDASDTESVAVTVGASASPLGTHRRVTHRSGSAVAARAPSPGQAYAAPDPPTVGRARGTRVAASGSGSDLMPRVHPARR